MNLKEKLATKKTGCLLFVFSNFFCVQNFFRTAKQMLLAVKEKQDQHEKNHGASQNKNENMYQKFQEKLNFSQF